MSLNHQALSSRFGSWYGPLSALSLLASSALVACSGADLGADADRPPQEARAALGAPVFSFLEDWENFRPIIDGSPGATHFILNADGFTGPKFARMGASKDGWSSAGRGVTPNVSGSVVCYAQMVLRHGDAGSSLAAKQVTGAIEVIDSASWTFIAREPVTVTKDFKWRTYTTAGWTKTTPVFVRAVAFGKTAARQDFLSADDLIVNCIPKPSAQQLRDECTNKCSSPCTVGFTGGPTDGIAQCIQNCADRCVARGHTF